MVKPSTPPFSIYQRSCVAFAPLTTTFDRGSRIPSCAGIPGSESDFTQTGLGLPKSPPTQTHKPTTSHAATSPYVLCWEHNVKKIHEAARRERNLLRWLDSIPLGEGLALANSRFFSSTMVEMTRKNSPGEHCNKNSELFQPGGVNLKSQPCLCQQNQILRATIFVQGCLAHKNPPLPLGPS